MKQVVKYLKIAGKWEDHILTAKINKFEEAKKQMVSKK